MLVERARAYIVSPARRGMAGEGARSKGCTPPLLAGPPDRPQQARSCRAWAQGSGAGSAPLDPAPYDDVSAHVSLLHLFQYHCFFASQTRRVSGMHILNLRWVLDCVLQWHLLPEGGSGQRRGRRAAWGFGRRTAVQPGACCGPERPPCERRCCLHAARTNLRACSTGCLRSF